MNKYYKTNEIQIQKAKLFLCKLNASVKGLIKERHQKKLLSNYMWSKQMKD